MSSLTFLVWLFVLLENRGFQVYYYQQAVAANGGKSMDLVYKGKKKEKVYTYTKRT
jgi:hypothetical protein